MIVIKSKNHRALDPIDSFYELSNLRYLETCSYQVWVSDHFDIEHSKDSLDILWGEAYLDAERLSLINSDPNTIYQSIGAFISIKISKEYLSISQDGTRIPHLFYSVGEDVICVSSSLSFLKRVIGEVEVDWEIVRNFVISSGGGSNDTVYPSLRKICWRESLTYNNKSFELVSEFHELPKNNLSVFETLQQNISLFTSQKNSYLAYSGGLDSSLILCAFHSLKLTPKVIHFINDALTNDNGEYSIAKQYAGLLGYDVMPVAKAYPATLIIPPYKVAYESLEDVPFANQPEINLGGSRNCFLIDGSGGDAVLVQNPSTLVGIDMLREAGWTMAIESIVSLSILKKSNIYSSIWDNCLFALSKSSSSPADSVPIWYESSRKTPKLHPWVKRASKTPAKQRHISNVLNEISSTSGGFDNYLTTHSPLLLQNIVSLALATPIRQLFTDSKDRTLARAAFFENGYDDPSFYNQKKSSSQLIFNLLNSSGDAFYRTVAEGKVAKRLGFNLTEIKKDLRYNMDIALTGSLRPLLQIYRAEIFLEALNEQQR